MLNHHKEPFRPYFLTDCRKNIRALNSQIFTKNNNFAFISYSM